MLGTIALAVAAGAILKLIGATGSNLTAGVGTMGLIRRVALDELGGWDEWCITEDAEMSLRLLRAGWSGLHVDESGGHGIMPLTFEALKGQRYRWCFGGIQILRMHRRSLLPGPETKENHPSAGQRWAYLAGGICCSPRSAWPPPRSTAGPPAAPRSRPGCASAAAPSTAASAACSPRASTP
ncbi:MAG TPA: glycosyltransferase family 2 protein [Trebonia sp.]